MKSDEELIILRIYFENTFPEAYLKRLNIFYFLSICF